MKACGIVVEYNPFHNGHAYHAQKAREKTKADVVVAVMSGNFLQRGEPAIIDKWSRTHAALLNGVDLVVELPIEWSLQSADYFAKGSIAILQALNCEMLCFGTDGDTNFNYEDFGNFTVKYAEEIQQAFREQMNQTANYAQKMTNVFKKLYPDFIIQENQPNHILGLSYSQVNAQYARPMKLYPITRIHANYHSQQINGSIASATAIRRSVQEGEIPFRTIPEKTAVELTKVTVSWENYWPLLKYMILCRTVTELKQIYQMTDGLEYRLKEKVNQAVNFTDFVEKVQSKRYSRVRIQRLLCYVLLNVTENEMHQAWKSPQIRILGFNQIGRQYLKEQKELDYPLLSRIGKKEAAELPLLLRADQVYQMGNPGIFEQNFGRIPFQIKNLKEKSSQNQNCKV